MRRQAEPALKDKSASNSDTKKPAPEIPERAMTCGVFLLRSNGPALTSEINVRLQCRHTEKDFSFSSIQYATGSRFAT